MDYNSTISWLFAQLPMFQRIGSAAYKSGLENTHKLDEITNHPHLKFKSIHVAGTNGKGSTSHFLASVLQESGLKVGLYTSPHLIDFRERIRVNGMPVSKDFVVGFVERYKSDFEAIKPSFFEMTVAMAFEYFAQQEVDIAVIEVGMGGRLDSTNIITPLFSVITNIGLDHTQFLGSSLSAIAGEKGGIIKSKVPVVVGERHPETEVVFEQIASDKKSELYFAEDLWETSFAKSEDDLFSDYLGIEVRSKVSDYKTVVESALLGAYQLKNLKTVFQALGLLVDMGFVLSDECIANGIQNVVKNTGLRGRWDVLSRSPFVVADIGHNAHGLTDNLSRLDRGDFDVKRFVVGVVNDKDVAAMLQLFPKEGVFYFCKASIPRALSEKELQVVAQNQGLQGDCFPDVKSAYSKAFSEASAKDCIYVGGSAFVVADLLLDLEGELA